MQDEGDLRADSSGTPGPGGIHKDPYRVTVTLDGRALAIGRCTPVVFQEVKTNDLHWIRYDIEKLLLSQSAALLALQGWPLMKFFEGVRFSSPDLSQIDHGWMGGTFVFLRGELSDFSQPPPTLSRIVLARIISFREGFTRDDILGGLVREIL